MWFQFLAYLRGIETGGGCPRPWWGVEFLAYLRGIET
ncbi:hypothetical protein CDSM653_02384 [Caldanaerobacter subterraneus subsp. pacificus DSM 12653]|uniref:Uncharacterized protein n=1 Tax=Caldanaerobacter subterraneus subsp. pacificus DSM 12653 TaxID=391606 RepID=A0A0F5PIZ2_9THEO|nr:hypothetical protein CDSM653_02384 [Caldanaerobacter subterraneus subsp. pacificus DSM 12653]